MNPIAVFLLVLKASLLSTGGMGNAPSIHADVVMRGWASERDFSAALAVGQLTPGPTGLWPIAFGYSLAGPLGAVAALFAILLPPLGALGIAWLYRRANEHPAVEGAVWGLGTTVAGVSAFTMLSVARSEGLHVAPIVIFLVALGLGWHGRLPTVVLLLLGAAAGVALG